MNLHHNAKTVLERRYLTKNEHGEVVETIDQMFKRVAKTVAQAETAFEKSADVDSLTTQFYNMMTNLEFMPNSPTLMNAGKRLGQLSACFVLPVGDSMEEIFESVKNAALIHKSGGGTGFSFSRLRSNGSAVSSTGGVASGPVSFMKVFNAATEAVKQGGTRRGANMGILRVDHPDVLEFIDCKKNNSDITNFNISIGITEKFMEAAQNNQHYDIVDPRTKKVVATLNANTVFEKIIDAAWRNGEPGIVFLDRLNSTNPTPLVGEFEATNPCGEQPLLPYESCNLGSINLGQMVFENNQGGFEINWDKLEKTIKSAVHFLDNVIQANKYPLPQIDVSTKLTRKIGLGVMGFADILYKIGVPYNSDQAVEFGEKLMRFVSQKAREQSLELAKKRGAFPAFEGSVFDTGNENTKFRNATTTTIAPTGTISIICSASSGIEPVFAISYIRNVMDKDELIEVDPFFETVAKKRGFYSNELMREIAKQGTIAHIEQIPQDIRDIFVTAHDISPEFHIKMQSAFQKYTDNAVSKTVNMPNNATRDQVKDVYIKAFNSGCKGVTIYRNDSRAEQVLNIGSVKRNESELEPILQKAVIHKATRKILKKENCPDCGEIIEHEGGCVICKKCGWGKCG